MTLHKLTIVIGYADLISLALSYSTPSLKFNKYTCVNLIKGDKRIELLDRQRGVIPALELDDRGRDMVFPDVTEASPGR